MSTDRPLLSLLLFAYNQEAYIRDALRGALAQTYSPLQILVSDDASTDGTAAIVAEELAGYRGPHDVEFLQNPENLGWCSPSGINANANAIANALPGC